MNQIIVFLGPSLPLIEAKKILPHALYFPPVKNGDILFAARLKPKIIIIIDGYFEHTSAVWHKEIIFAMEEGITVCGASSMGALRAAELADFGMIGVGQIFQDFYNSEIIDDDEVAILHAPEPLHYQSLTNAMVNIRATMKLAVSQKIIDQNVSDHICKTAKAINYRERIMQRVIQTANDGIYNFEILQDWLMTNYFDQKKEDTIELLNWIASKKIFLGNDSGIKVQRTRFFNLLHKNTMCAPFPQNCEELPATEKTIIKMSNMKDIFVLTQRLAHLMAAVGTLSGNQKISKCEFTNIFHLSEINNRDNWCERNDCTQEEKSNFLKRMIKIEHFINNVTSNPNDKVNFCLLFFMKLSGLYIKYKEALEKNIIKINNIPEAYQQEKPLEYKILKFTAYLWQAILHKMNQIGILPNTTIIQDYSNKFRRHHNLYTQKDTEKWLIKNDMNQNDFYQFIAMSSCFKYLILENNLDVLKSGDSLRKENVFWLLDAAYLTGAYEEVKYTQFDLQVDTLS